MGGLVKYKIVAVVRKTQNTLESLQARDSVERIAFIYLFIYLHLFIYLFIYLFI